LIVSRSELVEINSIALSVINKQTQTLSTAYFMLIFFSTANFGISNTKNLFSQKLQFSNLTLHWSKPLTAQNLHFFVTGKLLITSILFGAKFCTSVTIHRSL